MNIRWLFPIFALFFMACGVLQIGGTTDETNSKISGRVSYIDSKPASGAGLKLFRQLETSPLKQTGTDDSGNYAFDSLDPGIYSVWAESVDSVVAFSGSIVIKPKLQVTQDLTLDKSGSITAYANLQGGGDPRTITVKTLGTDRVVAADSTGAFTVKMLAKGTYTLSLSTSIAGYGVITQDVSVASGIADTLKDTIMFTMRNPYVAKETLFGVTYGNGQFVAVGDNGTLLTSSDAVLWSKVSTGTALSLRYVLFSDGLFVAAGCSPFVLYSKNGIDWSGPIPLGTDNTISLYTLIYGNGTFFIYGLTGSGSCVFTSIDGANWSKKPESVTPNLGIMFTSIFYNGSLFLGSAWNSDGYNLYSSSDGIRWTFQRTCMDIYAPELINGKYTCFSDTAMITSADGLTWEKQHCNMNVMINTWSWGNGRYVAFAEHLFDTSAPGFVSNQIVIHSTDGIHWDSSIVPNKWGAHDIAWGENKFVAVGGGGLIVTSTNGIDWSNRTSVTLSDLADIVWNGSQFITVGNGGTICSSRDGISWAYLNSGTDKSLHSVAWGNNRFVACGADGAIVYSSNGTIWNKIEPPPVSTALFHVTWGKDRFIAVGSNLCIASSLDGQSWTIVKAFDLGNQNTFFDVTYSANRFVAGGSDGPYYSTDGTSWTKAETGMDLTMYSITGNGDKFVAGCFVFKNKLTPDSSIIITSNDGINWTKTRSVGAVDYNLFWNGSQFLAFAAPEYDNLISFDGITWTATTRLNQYYSACAWDGHQYVFVGLNGTIFTCPPFSP